MRTLLLFLLSSVALARAAGIIIGSEAILPVPTNAFFSTFVNVLPGNGTIVSNNPPLFSWFYATNELMGGERNNNGFDDHVAERTNLFTLQVASNATFTGNLQVDVTTPLNFYNFLAPLDTNATRTFYWRVKYQSTSTGLYWTNGPYNFTVSATATNWDRSILATAGYYTTNQTHPIFGFRDNDRTNYFTWLQAQDDFYYALTNRATVCTNAAYFKSHALWGTNDQRNPTFANYPFSDSRVQDLGGVLLLWAISADNRWTNASMTGWLVTNLYHFAAWYNHPSNNMWATDYANPAGSIDHVRLPTCAYDWMYNFLGSDTATFNGQLRTNLLGCLTRLVQFWTYNDFYTAYPHATGSLLLHGLNDYSNATEKLEGLYSDAGWFSNFTNASTTLLHTNYNSVGWDNIIKSGTSHKQIDWSIALCAAVVIQQDNEFGRFGVEWTLNYLLAKTAAYAGAAAYHAGPYGYTDNHIAGQELLGLLEVYDFAYPQAQLYRTEFCSRFPEWWTRLNPYGMRKHLGPWGDGQPLGDTSKRFGDRRRWFDLAAVSRSGLARQLGLLNIAYSNTVSDVSNTKFDQLGFWYQYRTLPALETNTTSKVYQEDGYVIASQKSPSEFDCYTNGVGFGLKASPRGAQQGHNIHGNGSMDMWAYGTQLTDTGGGLIDQHPLYAAQNDNGLFINGYGEGDYGFDDYGKSQLLPVQSYISAFTNSGTNFVYTCADLTALFTNGWHPLSNIVTKVKRHVLFVRSKYWVIYDDFGASTASTFMWRWHVPWCFRYGTAGGSETQFTGSFSALCGSNSLALTTNGFTYTAGNYAESDFTDPPRIPVFVWHANDTNQFGSFVATGTSGLGSAASSVNGTSGTNSTLNPWIAGGSVYISNDPDKAAGIWVSNRVAATNFYKTTVIVPQEPGKSAPTFLRLADNAVAVTYDGVTETNVFGTNGWTTAQASYIVDLDTVPNQGGSAPSAPTSLAATPGNQTMTLTWGNPDALADGIHVHGEDYSGGTNPVEYDLAASATSKADTGLANGVARLYTVTRTNAYGSASDSVQSTPTASSGGRAYVSGRTTVGVLKK